MDRWIKNIRKRIHETLTGDTDGGTVVTVAEATEVSRDDYVDGQVRRLTVVTGILSMSSVVHRNGGYGRTEGGGRR
jgi:hypothetical protein